MLRCKQSAVAYQVKNLSIYLKVALTFVWENCQLTKLYVLAITMYVSALVAVIDTNYISAIR